MSKTVTMKNEAVFSVSITQEHGPKLWEFSHNWDGCGQIRRYFTGGGGEENCDVLHFCDLEDLIRRLQQLRDDSEEHFRK